MDNDEFNRFVKSDTLKKYITDLKKAIDSNPSVRDYLIKIHKKIFTVPTLPYIHIQLESDTVPVKTLLSDSRKFMQDVLSQYYQENMARVGSKVGIYKLDVKYKVVKEQRENPEYKEWMTKYGEHEKQEKEEEEKKEKKEKAKDKDKDKKSDDESSDKTKSKSKDKDKDDDKKSDKKEADNNIKHKRRGHRQMYQYPAHGAVYGGYGAYAGAPYGAGYGSDNEWGYGQAYIPPKPVEFKEFDKQTPCAEEVFIKNDRKPLEYLYLQEHTKKILVNYLTNFKEGKANYDKFGMPYKGGIILSGSPGCGKSSTIVAIGTFLDKDIFYIDLGKIRTNSELKLLLDHIKTNYQKGGIVIFEDIDCMTDIVFKREDSVSSSSLYDEYHLIKIKWIEWLLMIVIN